MPTLEKVFPWACWLVAAYFLIGIVWTVGFPPSSIRSQWPMLAAFGFFFLIPFVSKIDIFQVVSVERKLTEVKEKVDDTKEKVKEVQGNVAQMLLSQQSLSNAIQTLSVVAASSNSTASNSVTVNLPEYFLQQARDAVAEIKPKAIHAEANIRLDDVTLASETSKSDVRAERERQQIVLQLQKLIGLLISLIEESGIASKDRDALELWRTAVAIDEELNRFTGSFETLHWAVVALARKENVDPQTISTAAFVGDRLLEAVEQSIMKLKSNRG